MRCCQHEQWLALERHQKQVILHDSQRLRNLGAELTNPTEQKPSLLLILGDKSRSSALRFRGSKYSCESDRGIHLAVDSDSCWTDRPLLFANGPLTYTQPKVVKSQMFQRCHESRSRVVKWLQSGIQSALHKLYWSLIIPFCDVVCLFSSDFGGVKAALDGLATLLEMRSITSLPRRISPRLLLVLDQAEPNFSNENNAKLYVNGLMTDKRMAGLMQYFAGSSALWLPSSGGLSDLARYSKFKGHLRGQSDITRRQRLRFGYLFTAEHLLCFLSYLCDNFTQATVQDANPITISRLISSSLVPELTPHYITQFLSLIRNPKELTDFGIPVVASSFLFNYYVPGVHAFLPEDLYDSSYKRLCEDLFDDNASLKSLLRQEYLKCYYDMVNKYQGNAITYHRDRLYQFKHQWIGTFSDQLCLVCLQRKPEHGLRCKHVICGSCAEMLGMRDMIDELKKTINDCPLCGSAASFCIRFKPPSAGINVLSIDGGGIRAIIPLSILKILQAKTGLPIAIQEFFQFHMGTSSGSIISCDLSLIGRSIDQTISLFESLAKSVFKQPAWSAFIPRAALSLYSLIADGSYSEKHLQAALLEVFGDRTLIDASYATSIGAKIAIPTVEFQPDGTIVNKLFTNYNGVGTRAPNPGYTFHESKGPSDRSLVCEDLQCTASAPSYFRGHKTKEGSICYDGGLWCNHPTEIAWGEAAALNGGDTPHLLVSLGTGMSEAPTGASSCVPKYIQGLGVIAFLDHAKDKLANEKQERTFINSFRRILEHRYHRLDVRVPDKLPDLDDVIAMHSLKQLAEEQLSQSDELDYLARCLVASLFYFELDSFPVYTEHRYICSGRILCQLPANHQAFRPLLTHISRQGVHFEVQERRVPGRISNRASLDRLRNFHKPVDFYVRDLDKKISIQLAYEDDAAFDISGCPISVDTLIRKQGIDKRFGRILPLKRTYEDSQSRSKRRRL